MLAFPFWFSSHMASLLAADPNIYEVVETVRIRGSLFRRLRECCGLRATPSAEPLRPGDRPANRRPRSDPRVSYRSTGTYWLERASRISSGMKSFLRKSSVTSKVAAAAGAPRCRPVVACRARTRHSTLRIPHRAYILRRRPAACRATCWRKPALLQNRNGDDKSVLAMEIQGMEQRKMGRGNRPDMGSAPHSLRSDWRS